MMVKNTRRQTTRKTRRIRSRPITREYVHSLRGKYKGKGLLKALMTEKERERGL